MAISSQVITLSASEISENATDIIQQTIDQLAATGGGHLTLSNGTFNSGSLQLKSNIHLTIASNAVLHFSNQRKLYPIINSRWEGHEINIHQACLYANNAQNITIDGNGVVDGNGVDWWKEFRAKEKKVKYARPYLVSIEHSQRIKIRDLKFINSPSWTIHPFDCNDVLIDSITVKNPADSPNTDGTDPESCRNVRIINSKYDVGDDCIAIKAGTEDATKAISCENIVISNCIMLHGHGGIVLGSEMSGNIRNVAINNCTFVDTDRGIRFKTRRGRGGRIENILVSNIIMDHVLCPIVMNLYYFCGEKGRKKMVWDKNSYPINEATPVIRHVRISGITAEQIRSCAALIYGLPEMPIEDVHIYDSSFSLAQDAQPIEPAMFANAPKLTRKGFFIENTKDCELQQILITGYTGKPIFHQINNEKLIKNI